METASKNGQEQRRYHRPFSRLYIIRGGLFQPSKKQKRSEQFWMICKAVFWSHEQFTAKEVAEFIDMIYAYFQTSDNPNKTFHDLIQRLCLAKRSMSRLQSYLLKPTDWLNILNGEGFPATAHWLLDVERERLTRPHHHEGVRVFADALLAFCSDDRSVSAGEFNEQLRHLKQYDLQNLYHTALAHLQFIR